MDRVVERIPPFTQTLARKHDVVCASAVFNVRLVDVVSVMAVFGWIRRRRRLRRSMATGWWGYSGARPGFWRVIQWVGERRKGLPTAY